MRRFLVLCVLVPLFACKDEPKPDTAKPAASPEAIPSDMVYNSFWTSPSAAQNLKVSFDGGLDAGGEAVAEAPTGKAKVTDPGAEPRAKMAYAFTMGKPTTVVATISMSVSGGAAEMGGDQPPFKFTFTATPKTKSPEGKTHFEMKISKVEIVLPPAAPPEMGAQKAALEKAFAGVEGSFEATASGDVEGVSIKSDKVPRQAQELLPVFAGTLEFLVVPLPSAPIGVGGKWTTTSIASSEQVDSTVVSNYTLVSHNGQTAEIKADTTRTSPRKAVEDPRAPPGTMVEVKGSGSYTVDIRLDGVAAKADGASTTQLIVTAPGQPSQNTNIKQSQSLESK